MLHGGGPCNSDVELLQSVCVPRCCADVVLRCRAAVMCPMGDDPLSTGQYNRAIKITVSHTGGVLSGSIRIIFAGSSGVCCGPLQPHICSSRASLFHGVQARCQCPWP